MEGKETSEMKDKINELVVEVGLLKKDIDILTNLYEKVEKSLSRLDVAASRLEQIIFVQEKTLLSIEKILNNSESFNKTEFTEVKTKADALDKRVSNLEKDKWTIYGVIVTILFFGELILDGIKKVISN